MSNTLNNQLGGIIPAITSPCDEGDRFLEDEFERLACHLYQHGINGLYVCGATGDCRSMRVEERRHAAEIAVRVSRPFEGKVIVHIGTDDTRSAVALSEHAAGVGAAAVASMPPPNRTLNELVDYYSNIAKASQLPTFVYHIPHLTGHHLSLPEFGRLLSIPGVVGIKFSGSDLFLLKRLLLAHPEIVLFCGCDELLALALLYGAHGGIGMTYNIFPALFVQLYAAVLKGDVATALRMQHQFMAFLDQVMNRGGIKAVLSHVMAERGFGPFSFRRPCSVLSDQARQEFDQTVGPYIRAMDKMCGSSST